MICLFAHCAYLSETSRMLALYKALAARGAEVVMATHGGVHERRLVAAGVPYEIVGPHMTEERGHQFVRMGAGMGPPSQSMWTDAELSAYAQAEAKFFRERGVRAAVTGFTLTTLLSTRLAGITLITEHAGSFVPPVWERNMLEPFLSFPVPAWDFLPRAARRFMSNLGINNVRNYCGGFNRIAKQLGVEGVPSFAALLLGDLTLVPDAPEVLGISQEELEAWRPDGKRGYRAGMRMRYTGPLFAELDQPMPDRVQRFLEGPRPIVYVAMTSTTPDQVRAAVTALRDANLRVLVAGTVHTLGDLERENVMVEGVLPSHRIMPRVDLAVTAGGQGSVQCAMATGTPLLAVPLQPEQDFNGQLIERHGAGQRVAPRDLGGPKLASMARSMLDDARYRQNAKRIADIYAKWDGPGSAADAILEWVGEPAEAKRVLSNCG